MPRRSAGSDYDRRWWYVSRARAMMHDDAYRACALIYLWLDKVLQTDRLSSGSQLLRDNSSTDDSWPSLPTNQAHYDMQRTD